MSEHNGSTKAPAKTAARNMTELARDAVTLAQLQTQLAKAELQAWKRSLVGSLVLLLAAVVLALGAVPVLLTALAEALVEYTDLPAHLALLVVAAVGLAIAGIAAWIGLRKLNRGTILERSQEEFARNVQWIGRVLSERAENGEPAGEPEIQPHKHTEGNRKP